MYGNSAVYGNIAVSVYKINYTLIFLAYRPYKCGYSLALHANPPYDYRGIPRSNPSNTQWLPESRH